MKKYIISSLCFISLQIYAQTPDFSIEFNTSGIWNTSDPIHNQRTGGGDFDDIFYEICSLEEINPPEKGFNLVYLGRYWFSSFYAFGSGYDMVANPQNQTAIDLCENDEVAIVVWRNGRTKCWDSNNSVLDNDNVYSTSPSSWGGWVLDAIYYPNNTRQKGLETFDDSHEYYISDIEIDKYLTRYYADNFMAFDHPGPNTLWVSNWSAAKVAYWINFIIQVVASDPYTVLEERLFYVKVHMGVDNNCDSGFSGTASLYLDSNITIPDWSSPPF